jgi:CBS domain-containing protein
MDLSTGSEFADEYQDWLEGHFAARRAVWLDLPVGQLEPHPLLMVAPDTPVLQAIELMNAHERGAVLVVESERLVGIFTERDVLRAIPRLLDISSTRVSSLMTSRPDVLPDWATLAQALRTLAVARYRHLPVVDERGRPTAIVSMRRIIQFVCETFPNEVFNAPPEQRCRELTLEGA